MEPGAVAIAQLQAWRHISNAGMANKNILCMAEDGAGLLYIGTHGGLEVFDGRRYLQIKIDGQVSKGINPFVNALRWGSGGILWVATRSHIYTYNPTTGKQQIMYGKASTIGLGLIEVDTVHGRVYVGVSDGVLSCKISDTGLNVTAKCTFPTIEEMTMDEDGNLYVLTGKMAAVCLVQGAQYKQLYTAPFIRDVQYNRRISALVMLTEAGVVTYNPKNQKTDTLPVRPSWDYLSPRTRISILNDGELVVRHTAGISILRNLSDTAAVNFLTDDKNPSALHAHFYNCVIEDRHKNIWISEDGISISVLPANAWPVRYISATMTGAGRLWLSYHDTANKQVLASSEKGICAIRYREHTIDYRPGIRPNGLDFFEPMYFKQWNKEELLLLTNGQGSWLFNPTTYRFRTFDTFNRYFGAYTKDFTNVSFSTAISLSENDYLINGFKGLYYFRRRAGEIGELYKDGLPGSGKTPGTLEKTGFYSSYVDEHKKVWIGSGKGVSVLDSNFTFVKTYKGESGLSNTVILDIKKAGDNNLYVATMGGGVYRMNNSDSFVSVPLITDITNIYCIGIVDKDNLLITTSNGMCLYHIPTGTSRLINSSCGMPIDDFNQQALRMDDSLVMASGSNGVVIIDRTRLRDCFYDTSILLVMKGHQVVRQFTLQKGEDVLDFDLAIAGYAGAANWQIKYKLEGLDEEWHNMAKGAWHIRYNSINPGDYTLRVMATDAQNVIWVAPVSISISALPYFWQTLWFRLLMLTIAVTILVFVVRFFSQLQLKWKLKKLEDEQKVSRERIRISRELHDNVGSQLTYLITGLESSNILLQKQETAILEKKIEKMQSSARESMQQLRDSIWALNSETVAASVLISRFDKWLEHILEEFPGLQHSIKREINTDLSLDPIKSLNLFRIMQEAVHNVLKHAQASELTIGYICKDKLLTISIEDNGRGFDKSDKKGNGRQTMEARANEIGARYTLVSVPGRGTKVVIETAVT